MIAAPVVAIVIADIVVRRAAGSVVRKSAGESIVRRADVVPMPPVVTTAAVQPATDQRRAAGTGDGHARDNDLC